MLRFTETLCFKLGAASRTLQKYYNNRYTDHGVTVAQSFILYALIEEDGQSIKSLAEKLILDGSAVTGFIDRMEKEKFVQRVMDPQDRRSFQICLTEKGRQIADAIYPITKEVNDLLTLNMDPAMRAMWDMYLNNIESYLK
ncbi:MarR family transcriptional regulator [Dehalobacter sp.]|uniref:MarR family winged helix-turn-helix transcriptional regulator n=1 Tax=Dehalobacter sp. TaxID=1962289 RepID=UPI00258950D2|nr:MarR family transcriptional regulator [Dehalobacter sp.]MDJ0306649.1 MarR family transcriptional regulator [Dehalobacter sp.]